METKKLFKALAEFEYEVPVIHQGATGYGYSYADLSSIFKIIKPLLKKHGLGFTQLLNGDSLKTIIFHVETGETIESSVNILQGVTLAKMNAYQVLGSAITYYRRYALAAALGLITDKDNDAAGEATNGHATQTTAQPTNGKPEPPKEQKRTKPEMTKDHARYNEAVKFIASGGDMKEIEAKFIVPSALKVEMIKEAGLVA